MTEPYEVSDEELLRRAIKHPRARYGRKCVRWVAVMDVFAVGSTYAHLLCKRFDLDPDEAVKR